jgi:antitoxin PrlF
VGVKGQVVIPKAIREQIGIRPGDEVSFETSGDEVRIRRSADATTNRIKALRGTWAGDGVGTDALVAERRRERELEDRKAQEHGLDRLR